MKRMKYYIGVADQFSSFNYASVSQPVSPPFPTGEGRGEATYSIYSPATPTQSATLMVTSERLAPNFILN